MKTIRAIAWVVALTVIAAYASTFYFQEPRHAWGQVGNSTYPAGAIAVAASTNGASPTIATLPASPGRLTYLCNLDISPTAASSGSLSLTGLVGGTEVIILNGASFIMVPIIPCLPASAVNTAIVGTVTSSGGTGVAINLRGYQLQSP